MVRPLLLTILVLALLGCSSQSQRIEELSASPEATTAATTDEPEEVRVIDSGFVWDNETLSYAFTAENTSEDTSLEETAVQVSVYGKTGEAIGSDTGVLDFFLPGQVVAHTGRIPLSEEPDRIALAFSVEREATVENVQSFETVTGTFTETNFGGRVVAAINNPYERELRRLEVVAILRAEDGKILNGGSAVLELLPARGESIVTIDIIGKPAQAPARVDVYTHFSAETVFRLE